MTTTAEPLRNGRLITVSEQWGPLVCEHGEDSNPCGAESYALELSADEAAKLNSVVGSDGGDALGPAAITYILRSELGKAVCSDHINPDLFPSTFSWNGSGSEEQDDSRHQDSLS